MNLLPLRSSTFCLTRISVAAIAPRNLSLKPSIMVGSARLLSSSSNKKRVLEENQEVESSQVIKLETSGDLQAMTIQQLRTMSKKVGISARGSKHDLVSALKCFVDNEKDGHSSHVTSEMGTNDLKSTTSTSDAIKSSGKKAKQITSGDKAQNLNVVTEVLTVRQRKTRGKTPTDDSANFVVDSENLKTNKVSDTQPSLTKRKRSSHVEKEDGASNERVEFVKSSNEPWTILTHKKPQKGWIPYNPKTMRPPPLDEGTKFVKLISWNVNGLRALLKLDSFSTFAQREDFDILCLQETKLQEKDVEKIKEHLLDGYDNSFWTCSVSKLGYSGTAIISQVKPISVRYGLGILDHDSEGRLVTLEFDTFYLISGYVPNSGDGLKRLMYRVTQWDPSLANYMIELEKSKPVILTGDLNCAHQEIDIFNPAGNKRSAGFTAEERESFETNFLSKGFVDTFRRQHPGVVGYTYWGFRHGGRVDNKGWRLDYFLVSESIADKVHDSYIIPDVMGSDHCPIGLILRV